MAKQTFLPKQFGNLLKQGDPDSIMAALDGCIPDARDRSSGRTALAFDETPDDVVRWLVRRGANLEVPDAFGSLPLHNRTRSAQGNIRILLELGADVNAGEGRMNTPLHVAAEYGHVAKAELLLLYGAKVNARNGDGLTPLEHALHQCSNAMIERVTSICGLLLNAGAGGSLRIRPLVERIGSSFESAREGFNTETVGAASEALKQLYTYFGVRPIPSRVIHDVKSSIVAKSVSWQARHGELWDLLVPAKGPASTVQGEVIRISGRIAYELEDNGGINWDADFRKMADAYLAHVGSGNALAQSKIREVAAILYDVKGHPGGSSRVSELAVEWVALNEVPIPLAQPTYRR